MDLLKTHVTGVLLHGQQESLTFVDICQYSHDSNLTINILMRTLAYVSKVVFLGFQNVSIRM